MSEEKEAVPIATNLTVSKEATFKRISRLSKLMDRSITLPGGFKIGWDGIIGIVPIFGDLVGMAISLYIVVGAMRLGASKTTLIRMMGNIGTEAVVGSIPIAGDFFDLVFKANSRNMNILNRQFQKPATAAKPGNRWLLIGIVSAFVVAALLIAYLMYLVISNLIGIIF